MRSNLALAETLTASDDLGKLPGKLEEMIKQAEIHIDGMKGMLKRLASKLH